MVNEGYEYLAGVVYPWLTVLLFFYLPMAVMAVCNVAIIKRVAMDTIDKNKVKSVTF